MKIASFNINGIKARLPRLLEWLDGADMDVVCLQEIKCLDENFPRLEFEDRGWQVAVHGQKSFNGVAILSRSEPTVIRRGLPGDEGDDQARYMEAEIDGQHIACIYLPNGNPAPGPKYEYKLSWMDRLIAHARELLRREQLTVLAGDFNVIPEARDVYDPEGWADDALFMLETRKKFRALMWLGYTDALRQIAPNAPEYTFWDYQRGAWQKDHGLRIDHLLLSPQATDRLNDCQVDRAPRGKEKASDHTPIWCEIDSI